MPESKVALIPRIIVQGALGPREFGILLTDHRWIFVLETSSKAVLGAVLGGAIGAAIAQSASSRRVVDYENADPEALAREEQNTVIPHAAVLRLLLERKLTGYWLILEYAREDGKRKKIGGQLVAPAEQIERNKAAGVKPKDTMRQYAEKVREALGRCLPASVASRAEWRI